MKFEGFIIIGNPIHHRMSMNIDKNNSNSRPVEEEGDTNALVQALQSGAKKHPLTQIDTIKVIPMTAKLHSRAAGALGETFSTAREAYATLDATTNVIHPEYRRSALLSRTIGPDGIGGDSGSPM
mmetsp:Transcript_5233/g.12467  ORF Transcript_5233/g.12467 Transcript_5233/m.12467 type:complete len:125 (+) Transcript_5233:782-1156(+)